MRIVPPKPFTYEADGSRAVLLLHGFTGNTADVKMLGRYLQKRGYTCHAPLYPGHGVPPEELMETGPDDWWQSVKDGYHLLKNKGFDEIAVAGLSIGGVFALKLAYHVPVKAVVTMCSPMTAKTKQTLQNGLYRYAKEYKQYEGKSADQVAEEMTAFKQLPLTPLEGVYQLNPEVYDHIDLVYAPVFVVQARHDEMIDTASAEMIYHKVESLEKYIKWYEHSDHVITFGEEKDMLQEDIYDFLEGLHWSDE